MSDGGFSTDGGQKLAPDGTVSYEFEGSLNLLAGTSATPPSDRRIRWHRDTFTGAVVAELLAYASDDTSAVSVNAIPSVPTAAGVASLTARQPVPRPGGEGLPGGGYLSTYVRVEADPVNPGRVTAFAPNYAVDPAPTGPEVLIIDGDDQSDFTRTRAGSDATFTWLATCEITATAGPTSRDGYAYTYALPGDLTMPGLIEACWIDGLSPQTRDVELRVYANGSNDSVDAWFFNGAAVSHDLSATLFLAGS